jgi:hypothetical protein
MNYQLLTKINIIYIKLSSNLFVDRFGDMKRIKNFANFDPKSISSWDVLSFEPMKTTSAQNETQRNKPSIRSHKYRLRLWYPWVLIRRSRTHYSFKLLLIYQIFNNYLLFFYLILSFINI